MNVKKIEVTRPVCNPSFQIVSAKVHLDTDLSDLLPYLNATQDKAQYFPKTPHLNFVWCGHKVLVEKTEVRVFLFEDDTAAKKGAEEVVELLRGVDSKRNEITPDHTPHDPPSVMDVLKFLPKKAGCAKCGYPTCTAFATALISDDTVLSACTEICENPSESENHEKLRELLGV
jgi:ArsR family metal-binding transcriptional regulator